MRQKSWLKLFKKAGYEVVDFDEKADVYVINTCTVTNRSDMKSRQEIRKARKKNPNAVVVAVGCYVQVSPKIRSMYSYVRLSIDRCTATYV